LMLSPRQTETLVATAMGGFHRPFFDWARSVGGAQTALVAAARRIGSNRTRA
jgi:hypothetical protein